MRFTLIAALLALMALMFVSCVPTTVTGYNLSRHQPGYTVGKEAVRVAISTGPLSYIYDEGNYGEVVSEVRTDGWGLDGLFQYGIGDRLDVGAGYGIDGWQVGSSANITLFAKYGLRDRRDGLSVSLMPQITFADGDEDEDEDFADSLGEHKIDSELLIYELSLPVSYPLGEHLESFGSARLAYFDHRADYVHGYDGQNFKQDWLSPVLSAGVRFGVLSAEVVGFMNDDIPAAAGSIALVLPAAKRNAGH